MVRLIDMLYRRLHTTGIIFSNAGCRIISAVMVIFLLFTGNTPVKSQLISITPGFDTTIIWIGEQTSFTITLVQPDDMFVAFPPLSDTLSGKIEILSALPADTMKIEDNRLKINKSYRVTSFNRGEHYVGSLPFAFFIDDDQKVLHTRPVRLEVLAPEVDQEAGIYDIKDPLSIPLGFMEILPWILLLLLVALIIWQITRYLKRRKTAEQLTEAEEPQEPAHIIALRELRQLKSDSLWQKGRIKEFYTRLTEIVRIYIERRLGIMAMEQTSDEIIAELYTRNGLDSKVIELLGECFYIADLVKFAKARPGEKEHEACLEKAFCFINASYDSKPPDDHGSNADNSILTAEEKVISEVKNQGDESERMGGS